MAGAGRVVADGGSVPDLDAILAGCKRGDDLAWEALVRRYQGRVYSVAFHFLRDREEARDAAQEIFIKLYRGLGSVEGSERFLPWLLRLARNCCIDRLRRHRARTQATEVPEEEAPPMVAAEPTPEEASLAGARQGLLYRALGRLGDKNREIIVLHDIQELKLEEIAELLALPLGTVKSRSHRARLELAAAVRALDPSYGA